MNKMEELLKKIRACQVCQGLPLGPKPILQASSSATLLIISQAPGIHAHNSGIPWDDASGVRLREWLGISEKVFYNEKKVAIMPMGFCYPGKGAHGDLPPRKECYPLWHQKLLDQMPKIKLKILIGQYAQVKYLGKGRKKNLTLTVKSWRSYLPDLLPLPHPSPLNNIWMAKNRWFEKDLDEIRRVIRISLR